MRSFTLAISLGVLVAGATWSILGAADAIYEWTFDNANLTDALGHGLMEFADGATASLTSFGRTDGGSVPHIGGQSASYMHVPSLTGSANGYLLSFADSGPNGGGAYINRFTIVMDVLIPGALDWTALFNTDPANGNDADWYVAPDGSLGIAELGYSGTNLIASNTWNRLTFAADLGAGTVVFYQNGTAVLTRTGASLLDDRFSLYSNADPGPDLLLFNEGDTSGVYTHELYVASVAVVDRTLSIAEVAALGGPQAEGIFVQRLAVARNTNDLLLTWNSAPNIRLQKTTTLAPADWHDVTDTLGTNRFTEIAPQGNAFYRLLRQ